ncbi:MAG: hypothetical protein M5U15_01785 [Kiritimatiellae bacterium]|nr:hypothetical protein [Kiritimatiellia bacterium]
MRTLTLLAALFLSSPFAHAQPAASADAPALKFEVYSIGAGDMESTLEAVQLFVGDEGQVTPDAVNQRLLVATTPERHAQIAALMQKLFVPARNVMIEVAFDSVGSQDSFGASVSASGEWTTGINGNAIFRPHLASQSSTMSSSEKQMLLVSSGREATLRVGETVPYLQWFIEYGIYGGWTMPQLAWQEVGSFLLVQPTVIGDGPLIRIKLTPEISGMVNGRPEHVRFTSVATEVVAQNGQSVAIGGLDQHKDFYSRFLIGTSRDGSAHSINIRLTPRIQDPAPLPAR